MAIGTQAATGGMYDGDSGSSSESNVPDPLGLGDEIRHVFGKNEGLPEPSEEELALLNEQAATLREFRDITSFTASVQRAIQPILFQQMGFEFERDADGNVVGVTAPDDVNGELRQQVETDFLRRTQAALRGELPTDPALLRELGEREDQLQRQLIQDFGSISAGRTSAPGIERLTDFERFRFESLDKARRADLDQAFNNAFTAGAANDDRQASFLNRVQSAASAVTGQGFNQVAAGFGSAAQNLANNRQFLAQIQENRRTQAQQTAGAGLGALAAFLAA